MNLSRTVRRIALPVFRRVNPGDIRIKHHWTGDNFYLHSFRHKGYWWHGRKREAETMRLFAQLIKPGDTVFDIGAHIGYIGTYLSSLTGSAGQVHCFEPSPYNLPYLERNVEACPRKNIRIIRAAAGDIDGPVTFLAENLTGQNSTTVEEFKGLQNNSRHNGLAASYQRMQVPMITLDSLGLSPNFIKIDVESAELKVLRGMTRILKEARPRMIIETMDRSILPLLADSGYLAHQSKEWNMLALPREDAEGLALVKDSEFQAR